MQARFYAPWFGRFLSPDPARDQHFEQTQSWNIYSYVRNNPTMMIDPNGENALAATAGVLGTGALAVTAPAWVPVVVGGAVIAGGIAYIGVKTYDYFKSHQEASKPTTQAPTSPDITHDDVADKTREEIQDLAKEKGLKQKGETRPDGQTKWVDPVTGKERIRVDPGHVDKTTGKPYDNPNASKPHVHVNKPDGKTPVRDPKTGDKHIPLNPTPLPPKPEPK